MTDEEMVVLVQRGEKERYGEIVERYQGKLFWYVKRMINQSDEEVEDLLQEIFISAYVNIQGFETKKKFSSWIYRIAHNKAIDFFKTRTLKRRFRPGLNDENDDWMDQIKSDDKLIEELEIEREDREKIRTAIDKLDLTGKEVIELYFFEEKSYEEISEIMKIPKTNVGVLLFRAKKRLKTLI